MAGSARIYGLENITVFYGIFNLNILPASVLGTFVPGVLLTFGQGFYPCFLLASGLSALCVLLSLFHWTQF